MLKIKLKPNGKIHQRSFRIVVAECRSKGNGGFVDDIGFYTPQTKTLNIEQDKLAQWLKNGAQLTEGVDKLLNPTKFPKKIKRKVEVKEKVKEEVKEVSETPNESNS
jgi:small subunit ribosomal protein S16